MFPRTLLILVCALALANFGRTQTRIISGPMPGYSTPGGVGIWLQLSDSAEIRLRYWEEGHQTMPGKKVKASRFLSDWGNVAHFHLTDLTPGTIYAYEVLANDSVISGEISPTFKTQALWHYREDPPTTRIALGSCTYINEAAFDPPGTAPGSDFEIFDSIAAKQVDAMIWLGDNIYLRHYDLRHRGGYQYRYTHARSYPALQRLLRSTHHYAIWDDRDFGPDDANGSWIHKDIALEAFKAFWMNPSYGTPELAGITGAFAINDTEVFLLDNRYHRTSPDNKAVVPQILGKDQIEWLIEALKFSKSPFKLLVIGGQVLNPARVYENHARYEAEREYLLSRIVEEKIKGVVFLTGDRHHTELRKVTQNDITIYDLTVSSLTSGIVEALNESGEYLVDGTVVNEHNFGVIEISGERFARRMKISIFDKHGAELWSRTIQP